jgi:hypothetical protein
MPKFEKQIFVCGNQRPAGHSRDCDPAGEAKLQKLFKQKLAERGLKGKYAPINQAASTSANTAPTLWSTPTRSGTDMSPHQTSKKSSNRMLLMASHSSAFAWRIPA